MKIYLGMRIFVVQDNIFFEIVKAKEGCSGYTGPSLCRKKVVVTASLSSFGIVDY